MKQRCEWCEGNLLYIDYHDREWGVPIYESRNLFAKLILDGFQAGLSWITVLKKRDNFYNAFDDFNPEKIAVYNEHKVNKLLNDAGIIRNKLKIHATILNAQLFIDYEEKGQSFSDLLWSFVDNKPLINSWKKMDQIPANTKESDAMSKTLKKMGFKFVGTTICYAFMQAVGMVNDHLTYCFRYKELQ